MHGSFTGEGMPFSVSLLRNYGRHTKRNVNLWFNNTTKKSRRRTKEKQAKGICVKYVCVNATKQLKNVIYVSNMYVESARKL